MTTIRRESKTSLDYVSQMFPDLSLPGQTMHGGLKSYRLKLPTFPRGREFDWAELRIPKDFPQMGKALIVLSPDAILRVPHLDEKGVLCIEGDPGPTSGLSADHRLLALLQAFKGKFLHPWLRGILDDDFALEARNYWTIEVERSRTNRDPASSVWTVDSRPETAKLRKGWLLIPSRIVIVGDEELPITKRLIRTLGEGASQQMSLLVADIPISHALTPSTWPKNVADLNRILRGRLAPADYKSFGQATSGADRRKHRILLLRAPDATFAYLMPGGPATVVNSGKHKKTYRPLNKPLPLVSYRLDPAWTVGRDQHPQVAHRQLKHVVVLGAGALGSPVIDLIAKAGIGRITVVDDDFISPANIGRHLLGAESIFKKKTDATAALINSRYPATIATPQVATVEKWLQTNTLKGVDVVLDLTGEPDVRWCVDRARKSHPCPLLIGWMEPFVAAAHACILPASASWLQGHSDLLADLEAVTWPTDIIRREPGCSSYFQSYTAVAAAHAVALVAENALELIDNPSAYQDGKIVSWVRGQQYLDSQYPGLSFREWASPASRHHGLLLHRAFP